jgi:hypothetical protein
MRGSGNERSPKQRFPHLKAIRLLAAIGTLAATASFSGASSAQVVRLGVVMDVPRTTLEAAWTDDPQQVERAYCVTDWSYGVRHLSHSDARQDDTVFRVMGIQSASVTRADPVSVDFDCPSGMPELHVHTPTTCMGTDAASCVAGGLNAYSCQPSRGDLEKLVRRKDSFAVLQCDRHAFRFYYPAEYAAPGATTAAVGLALACGRSRPEGTTTHPGEPCDTRSSSVHSTP